MAEFPVQGIGCLTVRVGAVEHDRRIWHGIKERIRCRSVLRSVGLSDRESLEAKTKGVRDSVFPPRISTFEVRQTHTVVENAALKVVTNLTVLQ